jgi:hypothetical protein
LKTPSHDALGSHFICDPNTDSSLRDWWLNGSHSLRRVMTAAAERLSQEVARVEDIMMVPQLVPDPVDLSSAPELEEEYELTRPAWLLFQISREFFSPISIFGLYSREITSFDIIRRYLVDSVKIRAARYQCTLPEFSTRVHLHSDLRDFCVRHKAPLLCGPDCLHNWRNYSSLRNYFWTRVRQYPIDYTPSSFAEQIRDFNPEFGRAFGAVSGETREERLRRLGREEDETYEHLSSFADAMLIPFTYEGAESWNLATLDRSWRAILMIDSRNSEARNGLWVEVCGSAATAEERLVSVRRNGFEARLVRFWPRFFTATNSSNLQQLWQEYDARLTESEEEKEDCHICLESNADERTLCGHPFHRKCLTKWFLRSPTCPECRRIQPRG